MKMEKISQRGHSLNTVTVITSRGMGGSHKHMREKRNDYKWKGSLEKPKHRWGG
jgi:hypothetical protein